MNDYGKIMSAAEAVSRIKDGDRVMVGGFGATGTPHHLVDALVDSGKKNLIIISNGPNAVGEGISRLVENKQVKSMIGNYYSWNREVVRAYNRGEIEISLIPQGTFAEVIRAGGAGIPAFYVETSAGTQLAEGKESRIFNGKEYVLEHALTADVALIQAYKADSLGNLIYSKTARNFNPLMATAAGFTIAQVEEIVPIGSLDPNAIVTPHLYVDAIVEAKK
ncbi:MAG: CoA transferase subunit A [Candidatus Scatomorpha sp.]|jgi:3-oxoacid CoA-transferase subunit A